MLRFLQGVIRFERGVRSRSVYKKMDDLRKVVAEVDSSGMSRESRVDLTTLKRVSSDSSCLTKRRRGRFTK